MSGAVQNLLVSFNSLTEIEKHEAAVEILRLAGEAQSVPDSALCEIADELFQAMDRSESDYAKP